MSKSMKPGGGGRFKSLVAELRGQGKSKDAAEAIAASIGRRKYGNAKFSKMSQKGR